MLLWSQMRFHKCKLSCGTKQTKRQLPSTKPASDTETKDDAIDAFRAKRINRGPAFYRFYRTGCSRHGFLATRNIYLSCCSSKVTTEYPRGKVDRLATRSISRSKMNKAVLVEFYWAWGAISFASTLPKSRRPQFDLSGAFFISHISSLEKTREFFVSLTCLKPEKALGSSKTQLTEAKESGLKSINSISKAEWNSAFAHEIYSGNGKLIKPELFNIMARNIMCDFTTCPNSVFWAL